MRAKKEKDEERQMDALQRHGDTDEPVRQITTLVVYLGVEKQADDRDTATGGQDDAHGGTPAQATRAQLDTTMNSERWAIYSDTEEPLR